MPPASPLPPASRLLPSAPVPPSNLQPPTSNLQSPAPHSTLQRPTSNFQPPIPILGGGPAGLLAADLLSQRGVPVAIYDTMPTLGRKFLIAGKGGLNLTHSEPLDQFINRYGSRAPNLAPLLRAFGPAQVRAWAEELGIKTFIGTSGRVFPKEMKASPLLRAWLNRLTANGVTLHPRHRWLGDLTLSQDPAHPNVTFTLQTPDGNKHITAPAVILALGGGSWARLGSDGAWVNWLTAAGIPIAPLQPSNCGFNVAWTPHFRDRYHGDPVKSVILTFQNFHQQGEFIITKYGVEGSFIYAASALLRDHIATHGSATPTLDLAPDRTLEWLTQKLSAPRGKRTHSTHLASTVGIKGVKFALLREFVPKPTFDNPVELARHIKALPLPLLSPAPIDQAISTAGGVPFESLDPNLMLRALPGVFCAGEMLDWEAPTGGYLLTACLSTGHAAALGVLAHLHTLYV